MNDLNSIYIVGIFHDKKTGRKFTDKLKNKVEGREVKNESRFSLWNTTFRFNEKTKNYTTETIKFPVVLIQPKDAKPLNFKNGERIGINGTLSKNKNGFFIRTYTVQKLDKSPKAQDEQVEEVG